MALSALLKRYNAASFLDPAAIKVEKLTKF